MPIRRRKDRSRLKAARRLLATHVYERRASGFDESARGHYYEVFLWLDIEAARAAVPPDAGRGGCAWHCIAPSWVHVDADGTEKAHIPKKIGELHFVANIWNEAMVSHELQHAALNIQRLWPKVAEAAVAQEPMAAEELLCYRFGRMYDDLWRWLWDVDEPASRRNS